MVAGGAAGVFLGGSYTVVTHNLNQELHSSYIAAAQTSLSQLPPPTHTPLCCSLTPSWPRQLLGSCSPRPARPARVTLRRPCGRWGGRGAQRAPRWMRCLRHWAASWARCGAVFERERGGGTCAGGWVWDESDPISLATPKKHNPLMHGAAGLERRQQVWRLQCHGLCMATEPCNLLVL